MSVAVAVAVTVAVAVVLVVVVVVVRASQPPYWFGDPIIWQALQFFTVSRTQWLRR